MFSSIGLHWSQTHIQTYSHVLILINDLYRFSQHAAVFSPTKKFDQHTGCTLAKMMILVAPGSASTGSTTRSRGGWLRRRAAADPHYLENLDVLRSNV